MLLHAAHNRNRSQEVRSYVDRHTIDGGETWLSLSGKSRECGGSASERLMDIV